MVQSNCPYTGYLLFRGASVLLILIENVAGDVLESFVGPSNGRSLGRYILIIVMSRIRHNGLFSGNWQED